MKSGKHVTAAEKSAFAIVFGRLIVGGFVHRQQQALLSCQRPVFPSGAKTGCSCRGGVCEYVCSNLLWHGAEVDAEQWDGGTRGKQDCHSGVCAHWSEWKEGKCGDSHDFRQH